MNCNRVRDEIKAYIDGELSLIGRIRVQRHVAVCDQCRKEMEAMRELTESVQQVPGVPVPEGLRDRVMGRIEFEPKRKVAFWNRPIEGPVLSAVVVLAVIFVTAQVLFPTFSRTRGSGGRPAAQRASSATEKPSPRQLSPAKAKDFDLNIVDSQARSEPSANATIEYDNYAQYTKGPAPAPLLIIKTADISIRVKRFQEAYDSAVLIAKSSGGYVTDSSAATQGDAPTSGNLTMRVPVSAFERSLDRLGKLGKVLSKGINGEDVTGEAVDLESRLRNKRAEERQFQDTMSRAKRVQDIIAVSNELYRVRGEIEQTEGRLKYLKSAAAMATIQVNLSEKDKPKPVEKSSLMNTLDGAVGSLVGTLRSLAEMLIWLAVFSPFWLLPLAAYVWMRKKAAAQQA